VVLLVLAGAAGAGAGEALTRHFRNDTPVKVLQK
jgi:hypothetical protein